MLEREEASSQAHQSWTVIVEGGWVERETLIRPLLLLCRKVEQFEERRIDWQFEPCSVALDHTRTVVPSRMIQSSENGEYIPMNSELGY